MTCVIDNRSRRSLSARHATGLAFSALLLLGTSAGAANAGDYWDQDRHGEYHRDHDRRGRDFRDRGSYGWRGGYYQAPPVVYGSPYYAPPVVYGPSVGISLPGISVGIR